MLASSSLVSGEVCFVWKQRSIAARLYEWPSQVTTGSTKTSSVIGQKGRRAQRLAVVGVHVNSTTPVERDKGTR